MHNLNGEIVINEDFKRRKNRIFGVEITGKIDAKELRP